MLPALVVRLMKPIPKAAPATSRPTPLSPSDPWVLSCGKLYLAARPRIDEIEPSVEHRPAWRAHAAGFNQIRSGGPRIGRGLEDANLLGLVVVDDLRVPGVWRRQRVSAGDAPGKRSTDVAVALAAIGVVLALLHAHGPSRARGRLVVVVGAAWNRGLKEHARRLVRARIRSAVEERAITAGLGGIALKRALHRAVRVEHALVANVRSAAGKDCTEDPEGPRKERRQEGVAREGRQAPHLRRP